MPEHFDVIVIGAGAAGLAAAQELQSSGKNVVVLEAQEYIGGRIRTSRERGIVEAGAEFVHGEHAATWDIIRAENLKTEEWLPTDGTAFERKYGEGGGLVELSEKFRAETNALRESVYNYQGSDVSLAAFMRDKTDSVNATRLVEDAIARLEATDSDVLNVAGVAEAESRATAGHRDFFLPGGYEKIVQALARDLDIRLSHEVVSISWKRGRAEAICKNGAVFSAMASIMTIPLGVMQEAPPEFIPRLPHSFGDALSRIGFGHVTKTIFWIEGVVPSFQILSTRHAINFWQRTFGDETVLIGYSGGSLARSLSTMPKQDAIEHVLTALADALGEEMRTRVLHAEHFTWSDNSFVRGAYSFPALHMGNAREEARMSIEDTLYYAGEATNHRGHAATVHGALEEGRDAARRLLAAF